MMDLKDLQALLNQADQDHSEFTETATTLLDRLVNEVDVADISDLRSAFLAARNFALLINQSAPPASKPPLRRFLRYVNERFRSSVDSVDKTAAFSPKIGRPCFVVSFLPPEVGASHLRVIADYIRSYRVAFGVVPPLVLTAERTVEVNGSRLQPVGSGYRRRLKAALVQRTGLEPDEINLHIVSHASPRILDEAVRTIMELSPTACFFWGGIYESSFVRALLFSRIPIVMMMFNTTNAIDDQCDVVADYAFRTRQFSGVKTSPHRVPILELPKPCGANTRDSFRGLSVATGMTGNRIANALRAFSRNDMDQFLKLFATFGQLSWTFVGVRSPSSIATINSDIARLVSDGRIKVLTFSNNFAKLIAEHTVYALLPGLRGGGYGSITAAAESLPVLVRSDNDTATLIPRELVAETSEAFWSSIEALLSNANLRDRYRSVMNEHLKRVADPHWHGQQLRELEIAASEQFNA